MGGHAASFPAIQVGRELPGNDAHRRRPPSADGALRTYSSWPDGGLRASQSSGQARVSRSTAWMDSSDEVAVVQVRGEWQQREVSRLPKHLGRLLNLDPHRRTTGLIVRLQRHPLAHIAPGHGNTTTVFVAFLWYTHKRATISPAAEQAKGENP